MGELPNPDLTGLHIRVQEGHKTLLAKTTSEDTLTCLTLATIYAFFDAFWKQYTMHIIIVGAGLGGLSAALALASTKYNHKVTLLESARSLAEIGAGIQLTPNATKWLWRWGLKDDILAAAVLPGGFYVRSAEDSDCKVLGSTMLNKSHEQRGDKGTEGEGFEEKYGGPYLVVHRADLHEIIHKHCVHRGVDVKFGMRVVRWDFENGKVWVKPRAEDSNDSTLMMQGDLVVAADGIHSGARKQFVARDAVEPEAGKPPKSGAEDEEADDELSSTGYAAYRMMADVSKVKANPSIAEFVSCHNCHCVSGEGSSIMTYMIKGSQKLNLVMSHYDDVDTTHWSQTRFRTAIKDLFAGYNQKSKALLDVAMDDSEQIISNWPIKEVRPLEKWVSNSGRFVLMGDAAHAMSFFLSMGLSLAIEDAAALLVCLLNYAGGDGGNSDLSKAMRVYQSVRRSRANVVREASLHNGHMLHLPPGPERDKRDESLRTDGASDPLRAEVDGAGRHFSATRLSFGILDHKVRDYFYGYEIADEIHEQWNKIA